jgi:hypothetical protein
VLDDAGSAAAASRSDANSADDDAVEVDRGEAVAGALDIRSGKALANE